MAQTFLLSSIFLVQTLISISALEDVQELSISNGGQDVSDTREPEGGSLPVEPATGRGGEAAGTRATGEASGSYHAVQGSSRLMPHVCHTAGLVPLVVWFQA